jgi:hypothetical protein
VNFLILSAVLKDFLTLNLIIDVLVLSLLHAKQATFSFQCKIVGFEKIAQNLIREKLIITNRFNVILLKNPLEQLLLFLHSPFCRAEGLCQNAAIMMVGWG